MLPAGCFSGRPLVNPFLVLDLGLHVLDCVTRLNLEGYGLSRKCLDEQIHSCEGIIYTENIFLSHNAKIRLI